jgi:DNA-binding response OmpR family regulator
MPRLLLVEDAADVALIVERFGRRMGLEVAHRPDVASAWDYLSDTLPDLILLDLNLPGERGEALCRRVRARPETAHLPVALFTHWDRPEDVVSGLEAGGDYVVSKDLLGRPEAWQARLREILAAHPGPGGGVSLNCQWNSTLPRPSPEGAEDLNRVLRHPVLGRLGPDVARLVLRRAVSRAARDPSDRGRWLKPDGLTLDAAYLVAAVPGGAVAAFAVAVAEQLERLLGAEAAAPVREALRAAVDRAGE